ncbi:MAG: DnaB-like helicase C-terminal domain-containing protein [Candidatus Paceibacterota bacterium]
MTTHDTTPPYDLDSERSLLASCLLDPRNVDKVCRSVSGHDFHDGANGALYDAILAIHEAGLPIDDQAVLRAELARMGRAEQWPGSELYRLLNDGTGNHATYYAHRVRECSRQRRYLDIGEQLAVRALDSRPDDIASWLAGQLDSMDTDRATAVRSIGEIVMGVLDDLDSDGVAGRGLMTGLVCVDEAVGAMMPGESWVLAARPAVGKTSLAMQIAMHNAERDRPVLFVSLEMSDSELIQRLLCSRAKVNQRIVRNGALGKDKRKTLVEAASPLHSLPLRIWSPSMATIHDIRATARLEQKTTGIALLVVDYLHLVAPARGDEKRSATEQVTNTSNAVKRLAKELACPVLVLAQLNRESERNKTRPSLADLRQSGAIEQDADVVMFLHRAKPETELIVAKHRHGVEGIVELEWIGTETRYADPSEARRHDAFDQFNEGDR